MRFDNLDLNLLVALDALIGEQSVTGAARRLCISQPAVTASLNRLRDYFADELLVQDGRQMRLTHKAEQLAGPVRHALELIRKEITQPGAFDPQTSTRRFVLIASDYMYTVLLAELIASLSRTAPGVRFEMIAPSTDAVERFDRAEADLLSVVKPYVLEQHPATLLFRDEHVLVSWRESRFGAEVTAEEFLAAGHVAATFGRDRRPALSELAFEQYREKRKIELFVPSFSALALGVVGSDRLATMHRKLAEHFALSYPIRLHRVPVTVEPVDVYMQWHRLRSQDTGMSWLRAEITRHSAARFGPAPVQDN